MNDRGVAGALGAIRGYSLGKGTAAGQTAAWWTRDGAAPAGERAAFVDRAGGVHVDGALVAAIRGYPRWLRPEWAALAASLGDAAALAEAYRRRGAGVFEDLGGTFAVAIADGASVLLGVDRFGVERLCYAELGGDVVWSADAGDVAAHPLLARRLDAQSLFHYLYFHVVPSPATVYRDVRKLPPGTLREFRDGRGADRRWWSPEFADDGVAPRGDELKTALREAVRRCVPSSVTGAFLSGGLDSSSVAGMLQEVVGGSPPTYSIGFAAEGFDEIEYARAAAKRFGTAQHEYYVTPEDVGATMGRIAAAYDEPFGNASAVPVYFCAREALARGSTELLAGDGGDEIFGGNTRYAKQQVFGYYDRLPAALRRGLLEPVFTSRPFAHAPGPLRKLSRYVEQARVPMPDRLETYNIFSMLGVAAILTPELQAAVDVESPAVHLRQVYECARSRSMTNRMLWLDWKLTLADNDLRKVQSMCALAGVRVRYPMLDEDVVDLSLRLPPDAKVRGPHLRPWFRSALADWLPRETLEKSKHGFGLPFGLWLARNPALNAFVAGKLAAFRGRGLVREEFVDTLLARHQSDHATFYGTFLWVLVMLELWLETHAHGDGPTL